MKDFNIALACIGGLILLLAPISGLIKGRLYVSEPLLALLAGILLGPHALGLLSVGDVANPRPLVEEGARVTLAIAVVGTALRLPEGYPLRQWRPLAVMLGLVMPLMWLIGGALVHVVLGVPFGLAMLIGAVVTPTDPVLASSIVTGAVAEKNIPGRLRDLISAEAGANDGFALLFVILPLLLLELPVGEALRQWLTFTLLWEVIASVLFGALLGLGAGWLLRRAADKDTTAHTSLLGATLALALTVLGAVAVFGGDGVLAAFAAGVAFNMMAHGERLERQEHVQETITRFFTLPAFVLLGLAVPWAQWASLGWAGVILAGAMLLVRRLPVLLALRPLLRPVRGMRDALLVGWFGPIGVGALFYAAMVVRETHRTEVWTVSSLLICASVVAHGVSATPLTKLYGSAAGGAGRED